MIGTFEGEQEARTAGRDVGLDLKAPRTVCVAVREGVSFAEWRSHAGKETPVAQAPGVPSNSASALEDGGMTMPHS